MIRSIRKIAVRVTVIAVGCVLLLISIPLILTLLGYYVSDPGWKVGEIAYEQRNVNVCSKIINLGILGPPTAMMRAQCIREYAKLAKDPSACELLMPSSYGLSCVGGAENHSLPCGSDAYLVYWNDDGKEQVEHVRDCVNPNKNRSTLGGQCCQVAKVKYLVHENDCSSLIGNTPVYDRCLYELAWKSKEPKHCSEITNENAKAACEVQTKALKQDPSICSGCTPPVGSVEDLK